MNSTAYENSIVLQIDEANRAITNNGKNAPIILGVKGDDCAERVYFESPKILSPEIDLLDTTEGVTISVYINYKNASNEPYIQECSDVAAVANTDTVTFSWLVTNRATNTKGEVKFNVCVKKFVDGQLTNEWHTTTFTGKVLDGIDVTAKTPEVITHDTVTLQALTIQVQSYAAQIAGYGESVDALNETLSDVDDYIDTSVRANAGITYLGEYTDFFFEESNDYLASVTTPGVYTFRIKTGDDSSGKNTPYLLIVDNMYGTLYQAVYTNLSTDMFYKMRNSSDGGTNWTTPEQVVFAREDRVGVTYLGTYEDHFFEASNDYLASVKTPGMYTFRVDNGSKNTPYLLIVDNMYGTLYQAVYSNLSTDFLITKRSSSDSGTSWNTAIQGDFVDKSYLPDSEDMLYDAAILTARSTAGSGSSVSIMLNQPPVAGSKLRITFTNDDSYYRVQNTFVIEMHVVAVSGDSSGLAVAGQGSHFVSNQDWTGYINVAFNNSDETGELLTASAYTLAYNGQDDTALNFEVTNVEMISGEYGPLV